MNSSIDYDNIRKEKIIKMMENMDIEVVQLAFLYAKYCIKYGVDVTKTWSTATQNASALEAAHKMGYYEAMDKQALEELYRKENYANI